MDMDNLKWTKYGEGNDWVIDLWVWVGEGAVSPKLAQWQREIHPPTHARTLSRPSGQGRLLMWSKPTTSGVCPDARTEQPRRLASQPNHRRSWSHVNSSRRLLHSKIILKKHYPSRIFYPLTVRKARGNLINY